MSNFKHTNVGDRTASKIKGYQAPPINGHTENGGLRAVYRKQLSKSFGNNYNTGLGSSPLLYSTNILGPFRTSFNAGDVVTNRIENTDIKYGKMSNQVGGNNLSRLQGKGDGNSGQNGKAMYSGNPRHVYDGSDYARYKKLAAINKNFNDITYGNGSKHHPSQFAIRRVRR
jgi:hypothetical protein